MILLGPASLPMTHLSNHTSPESLIHGDRECLSTSSNTTRILFILTMKKEPRIDDQGVSVTPDAMIDSLNQSSSLSCAW